MKLMTHQSTFVAVDDSRLVHVENPLDPRVISSTDEFSLPAAIGKIIPGAEIVRADGSMCFIRSGALFASAVPGGDVEINRNSPKDWETFRLAPEFYVEAFIGGDDERFAREVQWLNDNERPVKVHFACGLFPIAGFLNVDLFRHSPDIPVNENEMFIFPTIGVKIPIPDNSVDFVFHEDFIEHIGQIEQIQFLAEVKRILKPGGIHRVNTPDLLWTMAKRSNFLKGSDGVYTGEREWQHISIYSRKHLEEIAFMVGYSEVHFMKRGESLSPYAIMDRRPFGDRDEIAGNIFADLKNDLSMDGSFNGTFQLNAPP